MAKVADLFCPATQKKKTFPPAPKENDLHIFIYTYIIAFIISHYI